MYYDDFDISQIKLQPTDIHQTLKFQVENIDMYLNIEEPSCEEYQEYHQNRNTQLQTNQRMNREYYKIDKYFKTQNSLKDQYLQQSRRDKLNRYYRKKSLRVWKKKISYVNRQKVAKERQRVNGKFTSVKKVQSPQQQATSSYFECLQIPPNQALKIQTTEWLEP